MSDGKRIPRRDLVPFWMAGGGFYGALLCVIFAVSTPWPGTAILAGGALVLAGSGVWRGLRARRDPAAGLHRELLGVLRSYPGERISRDERVVYALQVKGRLPLLRTVTVIRIPEDDVLAIHREGWSDLVVQTWMVSPWEYGITPAMHGTRVTQADIDSGVVKFARTGFWQWQKHQRAARKAGMLHAPADEVRALIGALRESEPLSLEGGS
jgi:hypothetical protein